MTRTIQDQDLQLWEAYASSGKFGSPDRGIIIFQCLTDPGRRARILSRHAEKSDVEKEVARLTDDELVELLGGAPELE
jgi:hypothetical protein